MLRPLTFITAALLVTAIAIACAPPQQIFMREKVIERNAAPRPGIAIDRFQFGRPTGPVDLLFVVDNSETGEPLLGTFHQSYEAFLHQMMGGQARLLDFRSQVVATPSSAMPLHWSSKDKNPTLQLTELFGSNPRVLNAAEDGFLRPIESTQMGLESDAYKGRGKSPLFLIYLLGADQDSSGSAKTRAGLIKRLMKARGAYDTSVYLLSRTSRIVGPNHFPYCNVFQPADQFAPLVKQVHWRELKLYDLCDPNWGSFSTDLFQDVLKTKSSLLLSQRPYQPETMILRGAARLFRYGDDYTYNPETNELELLKADLIQEGDLLEVSYFVEPGEQVLNGAPTPGNGIPSPLPIGE